MPPIRSRRASMVRRRSIKRTPMASTPKKIDNNDIKEPKDVIIAGQPKKDNNNNSKQETSIEEKKESGGLLLLKNNEAKSTSDAGTMTPTTGSAGQPQAPAASDSSKIEVYNIQIQQDFKKLAVLPPITVWSRAVDKNTFRTGVLRVCIKRKALLFDRRLASGCFPCVLTGQGHLIVYSELTDEGYAVNLSKAPKLCIKFAKPLFNESPVERICKLTARWLFGSVHLKFPNRSRKTIDWCTAILEAISDHPKAQLRIGDKPGTTTREEQPKQEQCVPVLRLLKTVEETAEKTTNEQKEEEGTVEQQEQKVTTTGAVNTAGPAASSHSDAPDSMATDSDSNSLDELEEEEDNEDTLAEPDAVEDQNSVLDSSLYSELELDDDIGDEEQQQDQREQQAAEKEDAAGPPTPPPAPMKRHVTFSNLKTIVEADKEDEEKEAAAEVSPAKNNSNTTGNNSDAEEWMDAVDDDGWEPAEKKEQASVPLMTDKEWLPLSWTSQGWEPEEEQAKAGHKKECAAHKKDNKTSTSCWLPPTTSAAGPVKNLQLHRNAAFQGPKPKPRCIRLRRRVPVNRRRIVKNNAKEER